MIILICILLVIYDFVEREVSVVDQAEREDAEQGTAEAGDEEVEVEVVSVAVQPPGKDSKKKQERAECMTSDLADAPVHHQDETLVGSR